MKKTVLRLTSANQMPRKFRERLNHIISLDEFVKENRF